MNENECSLNALFNILLNKTDKNQRIKLNIQNENGEWETKTIGTSYTMEQAYNDVKKALSRPNTYPISDVNGNPIPDGGYYNYNGGEMPPSMLREIGKQTGITSGVQKYFESYDALYKFISDPSWASKHPAGTYTISITYEYDENFDIDQYGIDNRYIGGHTYVGNGTCSSNKYPEQIELKSTQGKRTINEDNVVSKDYIVCDKTARKNNDSVNTKYVLIY